MKYALPLTLSITLFFLGACTLFEAKPVPPPAVSGKALTVPLGDKWQLTEEAPSLSGDRLPFQKEQSVQPAGARPVSPPDGLKIETSR